MIAAGMFAPGERVELIDGEIFQMTPQGSTHFTAIGLAEEALRKAFGAGFQVRVQGPLGITCTSEPQPDVAVVPGNAWDYWDAHPATALLLVEVSEATLEHDRQRKGSLYARAGIQDYWIVNLIDRCVEVYRQPHQGSYRSCQRFFVGDSLAPLAAPEAMVSVADIFRRE
jgi:Uma2 family endonuclease